MSFEIPEDVSLEELISHSQYILIVERAKPFEDVEMVKLHEDPKKCPPFRRVTYRYRVLEELLNKRGLKLKEVIEVVAPHTSMDIEVHRKRHLEGVNKSTFRPEYPTEADFNSKKLIIFLGFNFEFVADGAYESVENKEKVLKAIGKS